MDGGLAFEPVIKFGDLLQIAVIIFGGGGFFALVRKELRDHGRKIEKLEMIVTIQARHDERLLAAEHRQERTERRLDELAHGKGWVQSDIDGEYSRRGKVQGYG